MGVKCSVCAKESKKRKVIKRMPVMEIELPEKYGDCKEFMCMNIIKLLGKDRKWHDNVCKNRMLVLKPR